VLAADFALVDALALAAGLLTFGATEGVVSAGPDASGVAALGVVVDVFTPGSRSSGRGTFFVGAEGAGVGGVCCANA
jgi:hypothetical protein